jgi:BolA family transcriptional regulator, general stress-responsive regulator
MAPSRLDRVQKRASRAIDLDALLRLSIEHDLRAKSSATVRDHAVGPAAMRTRDLITEKLRKAFAPDSIRVEDESHRHEGHAGHRPGGETHFRLYIVSDAFRGKSRLERHRMINAALASELAGGVHALAIHAAAPGEAP